MQQRSRLDSRLPAANNSYAAPCKWRQIIMICSVRDGALGQRRKRIRRVFQSEQSGRDNHFARGCLFTGIKLQAVALGSLRDLRDPSLLHATNVAALKLV